MVKHSKSNLNVSVFLIIGLILISAIGFGILTYPKEYAKPSAPNYLGLAQLNLIPTTNQCSYNEAKVYTSTDVIANTHEGQYLILESKFGDEYCPIRIK
jgi:hypothetical protein